jgi:hypothetical protein
MGTQHQPHLLQHIAIIVEPRLNADRGGESGLFEAVAREIGWLELL